MAIDQNEFRRVMGHFATGVTVVTTRDPSGERYGLTANAVCSVSLDPPLLLICVDRKAESHDVFGRSQVFAVCVLDRSQEALSRRFAVSGGDKFEGVAFRDGTTGAPLLDDVLALVECRIVATHPAGDHTIYLGQVVDADATDGGEPLLFYRGGYRELGG